jgi:hypothetical protein
LRFGALAQAHDLGEVGLTQRWAVQPRLQSLQKLLADLQVACARARFEHRLTLPRLRPSFVVVQGRRHAPRQRAQPPFGTQAHIHAEHNPAAHRLGQRLDHHLGEFQQVLRRVFRAHEAWRVAIQEDGVNIGAVVEFASAPLAHREDAEAVFARDALLRGEFAMAGVQRGVSAHIGEVGQCAHRLGQRRLAQQVKRGDAQVLLLLEGAQAVELHPIRGAGAQQAAEVAAHLAAGARAHQQAHIEQNLAQFGVLQQRVRHVVRRAQHGKHGLERVGRLGEQAVVGQRRAQRFEPAVAVDQQAVGVGCAL